MLLLFRRFHLTAVLRSAIISRNIAAAAAAWLRKLDRKAAEPIIGGKERARDRGKEGAIELFMSSRPLIPTERTASYGGVMIDDDDDDATAAE